MNERNKKSELKAVKKFPYWRGRPERRLSILFTDPYAPRKLLQMFKLNLVKSYNYVP